MASIINEKLGAWLLEKDNSQSKLAIELGISRPTLSRKINGKADWRFSEVKKIAKITNTSLDELAG